jgi:hypothetical protein
MGLYERYTFRITMGSLYLLSLNHRTINVPYTDALKENTPCIRPSNFYKEKDGRIIPSCFNN